jgi:hypothetical protein
VEKWKTQPFCLKNEVSDRFGGMLQVPTSFVLVMIEERGDFFRHLEFTKTRNESTEEVRQRVKRASERWRARWLLAVHDCVHLGPGHSAGLKMYRIVKMAAPHAA